MDSPVNTAGRLATMLKSERAELVNKAVAEAPESVCRSDLNRAFDRLITNFESRDPKLDAKVALAQLTRRIGPDNLPPDQIAVMALALATSIGTALTGDSMTAHFGAAAAVTMVALSGCVPSKGAPLELMSETILERAAELTGGHAPEAAATLPQGRPIAV